MKNWSLIRWQDDWARRSYLLQIWNAQYAMEYGEFMKSASPVTDSMVNEFVFILIDKLVNVPTLECNVFDTSDKQQMTQISRT